MELCCLLISKITLQSKSKLHITYIIYHTAKRKHNTQKRIEFQLGRSQEKQSELYSISLADWLAIKVHLGFISNNPLEFFPSTLDHFFPILDIHKFQTLHLKPLLVMIFGIYQTKPQKLLPCFPDLFYSQVLGFPYNKNTKTDKHAHTHTKENHHDLLVGAQPSPCCSFARHLVGNMTIHCSFAHH